MKTTMPPWIEDDLDQLAGERERFQYREHEARQTQLLAEEQEKRVSQSPSWEHTHEVFAWVKGCPPTIGWYVIEWETTPEQERIYPRWDLEYVGANRLRTLQLLTQRGQSGIVAHCQIPTPPGGQEWLTRWPNQ